MSEYHILDGEGAVINTIVATEAFVEAAYPGRWRLVEPPQAAPQQRPAVVITHISADPAHAAQTRVADDLSEVTLPVGATLTVAAELRAGDQIVPLTEDFRLPLVSTDGRQRLVLASMVNGQLTMSVQMRDSRLWRLTEADINEHLPDASKMVFAGLTIYAVEVPGGATSTPEARA